MSKTPEQIIEYFNSIHGYKYNYEVGSNNEIKIVCKKHGLVSLDMVDHLIGHGCNKCAEIKIKVGALLDNALKNNSDINISIIENFLTNKVPVPDPVQVASVPVAPVPVVRVPVDTIVTAVVPAVVSRPKIVRTIQPSETTAETTEISERVPKKRKTNKEFTEDAIAVHGNKYIYTAVEYVNCRTEVTIICKEHGPFEQTPVKHLLGAGCDECKNKPKPGAAGAVVQAPKIEKVSKNELFNFIEKSRSVHGSKYDYSQVKYVNLSTKVIIVCKEHGPFKQIPNNHLKGQNCMSCSRKDRKRVKMTTESFICKAIKKHGNKYDYSNTKYINSTSKLAIKCKEHGTFIQTPISHLKSSVCCPVCRNFNVHISESDSHTESESESESNDYDTDFGYQYKYVSKSEQPTQPIRQLTQQKVENTPQIKAYLTSNYKSEEEDIQTEAEEEEDTESKTISKVETVNNNNMKESV